MPAYSRLKSRECASQFFNPMKALFFRKVTNEADQRAAGTLPAIFFIYPHIIDIHTTPWEDIAGTACDDFAFFIYYFFAYRLFFSIKAIKHWHEFKVIITDEFLYSLRILTSTSS